MEVFETIVLLLFHPKNPFLYDAKMFHLYDNTNENNEDHIEKWPYIPHHQYRMLIIRGSGSG